MCSICLRRSVFRLFVTEVQASSDCRKRNQGRADVSILVGFEIDAFDYLGGNKSEGQRLCHKPRLQIHYLRDLYEQLSVEITCEESLLISFAQIRWIKDPRLVFSLLFTCALVHLWCRLWRCWQAFLLLPCRGQKTHLFLQFLVAVSG